MTASDLLRIRDLWYWSGTTYGIQPVRAVMVDAGHDNRLIVSTDDGRFMSANVANLETSRDDALTQARDSIERERRGHQARLADLDAAAKRIGIDPDEDDEDTEEYGGEAFLALS